MMTPNAAERHIRRAAAVLCAAVPVAFGGLALALGQDANWDLRNYHWYNPYALLTDRWEFDLGIGATYNPIVDVPMYLAAHILSAKALSFVLGLLQGLNVILLFALGRLVLKPMPEPSRTLAALAAALVGVTGAGAIALVGTTFNDTILSLFVLGALLIVATRIEAMIAGPIGRAMERASLAGLVMGLAVGLKLPMAVFAVGLSAAFFVLHAPLARRFWLAFASGLGVLAGIALSAGAWMWRMWDDYHNPFFPYFNGLFRSPMGLPASYRDVRFLPHDLIEAAFFPVVMVLDPKHVGEIAFRDLRVLAAYAVLLATPVILFTRRRIAQTPAPEVLRYLTAAAAISFVVWLGLFAVYRYIIPLEMLSPVLAIAVIALWPVSARTRTIVAGVVLLIAVATTAAGTWGRRDGWTDHLVEVTVPPIPDPAHTVVVMIGIEPLSYVVPFLAPEIPVLRLQGYLTDPKDEGTGFNQLLRRKLGAHSGDIYLLTAHWERDTAVEALSHFGLVVDFDRCGEVASNIKPKQDLSERVELCPVAHATHS